MFAILGAFEQHIAHVTGYRAEAAATTGGRGLPADDREGPRRRHAAAQADWSMKLSGYFRHSGAMHQAPEEARIVAKRAAVALDWVPASAAFVPWVCQGTAEQGGFWGKHSAPSTPSGKCGDWTAQRKRATDRLSGRQPRAPVAPSQWGATVLRNKVAPQDTAYLRSCAPIRLERGGSAND